MTLRDLYVEAWERLRIDRAVCAEIDGEATPVVVFGQWQTARVVTAGLNPSEAEFRDKTGVPLQAERQRFLHWPPMASSTKCGSIRRFIDPKAISHWATVTRSGSTAMGRF